MTAVLRKTITGLCLFTTVHAYAQKSYIVTVNNDTLYGEVLSIRPKVKIRQADGKKTLQSEDVKFFYAKWMGEYRTLYRKYLSSTGKTEYLERLENGKISLYEKVQVLPEHGYAYYWYAQKDSGEMKLVSVRYVMLSNKGKQKEELTHMLSDQKELADQFANEANNKIDIVRKYIQLYNKNSR